MEKKFKNIHITIYSLFIAKDCWSAHYQILLIIFLKEFIELNVNTDMTIKKCETCKIKYNYCDCFLE